MINYLRRRTLRKRLKHVFDVALTDSKWTPYFVLFFGIFGLVLGFCILFIHADSDSPVLYEAVLTEGEKQVYDGDTLKDVRITILYHKDKIPKEPIEVWPGIWVTAAGVEVETDIRIAGIDTPEKRPLTKHKDGTKRSEASRNKEKAAAAAARQAVIDLLKENAWQFDVTNPMLGKYAGRVVADVNVIDEDVARYLILNGHAKAYDGGTKPKWDWGQ